MLHTPVVSGDFPGGTEYTRNDAPNTEPTDWASLLTTKGPIKLGDSIDLLDIGGCG